MTPEQAADNTFYEIKQRLARKPKCQTALEEVNRMHTLYKLQQGNSGELRQGDSNGAGTTIRRVLRRAIIGAIAVSATIALAHLFANAAAQQAEFNQKVACEQAGQKINEWARDNGKVPPCRT
jgi:hypothetical protein